MQNEILSILKQIQGDMSEMKEDIRSLKEDVNTLKADVNTLKQDVELIKIQQKEHSQILKALEHSSQVHKAAIDDLTFKVSKLDGKMNSIRNDLNFVEYATANNMYNIAMLKRRKRV
ncbi:hypothetical protein SAMN05661008_00740 [Alkalithermobacter thermoalcaliphilus JW-YL-7 = DSM 7308]|uniref:Uncharacterized protein n=1 Tax=Alkalithermobacter thermoalcaliphilus JW-YL-7 = DSM 7308 TaxID=1121328 RepID=A0A150FSI2_CLOPD|nr:hypothetical protein JWYL7_1637 [[Clostridium] paradoxum JW-YL-7 = DSM 7308]SHK70590.1 hypothetical protein SAMN05661008_00740 [[Clostridium] paradoxum JW-YL-7 = DSM 7308]